MTIPEFLNRLRAIDGWEIIGEQIRCHGKCPIAAVASERSSLPRGYLSTDFVEAGRVLGLGHQHTLDIVHSADYDVSTDLRRELLAATVERM